jgi:6-phosphogluconolactonase
MVRNVQVYPDRQALIQSALALCLQASNEASTQFTIAVAGGNTPKPLYQALKDAKTDWQRWHIFFGDERFVPPTDPQSNQKMVRETWLNHVPIPESHIHPMPTDQGDPPSCAKAYEDHLRQFFQLSQAQSLPQFDLVLLGMGEDGHTASLFPHAPALEVHDSLVTVGNKDGQPRLTLTLPVINNAKQIVFLVEGQGKAQTLAKVLAVEGDDRQYPARLVDKKAIWLVDRSAAEVFMSQFGAEYELPHCTGE